MDAAQQLLDACFKGDAESAVSALRSDRGIANARCGGIDSPALVVAAHRGHIEIVRALLDAGAEVNAREGVSDTTALHWAAEAGHPDVATALVDAGADLSAADGWFALRPLGWACAVDWNPRFREDRPATIRLLLERGAGIDVFCAIALGLNREIPKLGPQAILARLGVAAAYGSPLHFAVACARDGAVRELLKCGARLDCLTADGLTPLGLALLENRDSIVGLLRAAGAEEDLSARVASNPRDVSGATVTDAPLLHALAERNRAEAIRALLAAGLPPDFRVPALVAAEEQVDELTPLARAAGAGHLGAAEALLSGGADPNGCVGKTALTPLHLAARNGNEPMVRLLLDAGADPGRRDRAFHATPGGFAGHFGHRLLAELLGEKPSD